MRDKPSQPAQTTHSKEGPSKTQSTSTGTCTEHTRCAPSVPSSIVRLPPSIPSTAATPTPSSSSSLSSSISSSSPQKHTSFTSTSREPFTIPESTSATISTTNVIANTSTRWSSLTRPSTTSSLQVSVADPSSSEVSPGPTDSPSGRHSETPAIVGAVLGGSIFVVLLFVLLCVRQRRKRNRQSFITKFEPEKCEPSMIWLDNIQQDISNLRSDTAASAAVRRSLSSHSSYSADYPRLPTSAAARSAGTERGITYDPEDDGYDRLTSEDMSHVHRRLAFEAAFDGNQGVCEAR